MLDLITQATRIAVPFGCAAVGGSIAERSGVIDLALESKLLWGAFAAATVGRATGSLVAGIAAGIAAGAAVGLIQLLLAVVLAADQVVVGVALNLAALGTTRYLLAVLYGQSANSPPCPGIGTAVWDSPIFWIAVLGVLFLGMALARTAIGLRVRAAGDRPGALPGAGVNVTAVRAIALVAGGAIAGLGGAQLALAAHGFSAEMSGGRGYIALALVILGGWRPLRVALLCLGFGVLDALTWQLLLALEGTGAEGVRSLVQLFPYVVTLAVLMVAPRRIHPPAALGRAGD